MERLLATSLDPPHNPGQSRPLVESLPRRGRWRPDYYRLSRRGYHYWRPNKPNHSLGEWRRLGEGERRSSLRIRRSVSSATHLPAAVSPSAPLAMRMPGAVDGRLVPER